MALSKSDLLNAISQYQTDNKRPCPKKEIIASHGEDALDVLAQLLKDGSVACRRGRNGGFYPVAGAAASNEAEANETVEEQSEDIAGQFAALEARLAAAEAEAAAENAQ